MRASCGSFDLETFTFNGKTLRTVVIDGKPWFAAIDVLAALGLNTRHTQHIRYAADDDEYLVLKKSAMPETGIELRHLFPQASGGRGSANALSLISESGLYKFTLRAQRSNPAARDFQDWVTKDVLPRIRRGNVSANFRDRSAPPSKPARSARPHPSSHFRDRPQTGPFPGLNRDLPEA